LEFQGKRQREIESLKGSRSWRLTALLRWIDNSMRSMHRF
jgi:hypothetical protein